LAKPSPDVSAETPGFVLFDRFPALQAALPRVTLGRFPTPLSPLPELALELGMRSLTVKRDDVSAEPYGGGKPRKLELILGAAVAEGRDGVVTFGGVGSHHAAATAIYAKRLGLGCQLMLVPQPPTDEVRRVLMTCARHGAKLTLVGSLASGLRRAQRLGDDYAIIAAGGSDVRGNCGFVNAALELDNQIQNGRAPRPDAIYLAVGTMGSAVGLLVGLQLAHHARPAVSPGRVFGVRASSWAAASPRKLEALHRETSRWLHDHDPTVPMPNLPPGLFQFENRFLGRGYALPTRAGQNATQRAALHGLTLDDTYTAKAFAALLANAPQHRGQHVLFWHTHSHARLSDEGSRDALPPALRSYARG
jgi:D-cysteine desulfhydrase